MDAKKSLNTETCPVCNTVISEEVELYLCPQCGWEIDRAQDELIIGDVQELRREAERKQQKLQQYRKLYYQAQKADTLETRLKELEQQLVTLTEKQEQRIHRLETQQQDLAQKYEEIERSGGGHPIVEKEFTFETLTINRHSLEVKRRQGAARQYLEIIGVGVPLEMVYIPGGTFLMGSSEHEEGHSRDEGPQHQVTLSPFWVGKYPVTQEQWFEVLHSKPSKFKGLKRPVENVSWEDAIRFCERLSTHTGRMYRLPTEAEWEYACRAGTTTPFSFGETITSDLANYDKNNIYRNKTSEVGSFPPNASGLHDMHGNVWEWCQDVYSTAIYAQRQAQVPIRNPVYERGDSIRVLRGGSWNNYPAFLRSAYRSRYGPDVRKGSIGFRLMRTI